VKFDSAKENSVIHIPPLIPVTKKQNNFRNEKENYQEQRILVGFPNVESGIGAIRRKKNPVVIFPLVTMREREERLTVPHELSGRQIKNKPTNGTKINIKKKEIVPPTTQ
jgi:hypothetical protein